MIKRNLKGRLCKAFLFALTICILVILFASPRFDKRQVWTDVALESEGYRKEFSLAGGDTYGVKTSGPFYDLPPGEYRLKWQILANGDNEISLSASNEARIVPDRIPVSGEEFEGEASFQLLDPAMHFSIGIAFSGGDEMEIVNLRLYSPGYKDHAFIFLFIILILYGCSVAKKRGRLTETTAQTLLLITMAAVAASVPSFSEQVDKAADVNFHTIRLLNLADALRSGQIPARVGGYSCNGWGAVTSVFYPDLFLYPFALMILCDASVAFAVNCMTISIALLSGFTMTYATERILRSRQAGLCAGILYVFSGYRLGSVYSRFMLGEMLAMAFIPLFLLGLWRLFLDDEKQWPVLALSAVAIWNCHMVSTVLCFGLALAAFLFFLPSLLKERNRRVALVKTVILTLLLSLTRLVPFLHLYLSGQYTGVDQHGFLSRALSVSDVLRADGWIGALIWAGLASMLSALREEEPIMRRCMKVLATAGVLLIWPSTKLFPWTYVFAIFPSVGMAIQFPYRFLVLSVAFLAVCGGYGYPRMLSQTGKAVSLLLLLFSVLFSLPYLNEQMKEKPAFSLGQTVTPYSMIPDYQLESTDLSLTRSRSPIVDNGIQLEDYEKDGTEIRAIIRAEERGSVSFPLFSFVGYETRINGSKIPYFKGENNRLTVSLPAGMDGELTVRWRTPLSWRVADFISLTTVVGFFLYEWKKKRRSAVGGKDMTR